MKSVKLAIVTAAVLTAVPALAQLKLDANLEYTYGYRNDASAGTTKAANATTQSGRVEVIALSRREAGDAFFEAKGVVRLFNNNSTVVRDIYGQFGRNNAWNLKFGRFEATDLFPTGKDQALVDTPTENNIRGNGLRGRFSTPSHFALTVNASPSVSVELGAVVGTETTNTGQKSETVGLRPVVAFKAGAATVKVGLESNSTKVTPDGLPATTDTSLAAFAVTAALPVGGGNMNVNLSNSSLEDKISTFKLDTTALGINGTWGGFGAGVILNDTKLTETGSTTDAKETTTSLYAAYSLPVLAVPNATFTVGAGLREVGGDVGANTSKSATLLNARFNYTF